MTDSRDDKWLRLLDQLTVRAADFANQSIKVVRRDEAEAIIREALSDAQSATFPREVTEEMEKAGINAALAVWPWLEQQHGIPPEPFVAAYVAMRALETRPSARTGSDEHVAWCRYVEGPTATTIVLCDSDTPRAFKVYRAAPSTAAAPGNTPSELAEAHAILDKSGINRKYSMDSGETWIVYTLAERVNILAGAYRLSERELAEENKRSEDERRCGIVERALASPSSTRREGHSALRVKDGKLEVFDPHPASGETQRTEIPVIVGGISGECQGEKVIYTGEFVFAGTALARIEQLERESNEQHEGLRQGVAKIGDLERELAVTNALLTERERVLKAIPGCEAHGDQCVPHALEWIAEQTALSATQRSAAARVSAALDILETRALAIAECIEAIETCGVYTTAHPYFVRLLRGLVAAVDSRAKT